MEMDRPNLIRCCREFDIFEENKKVYKLQADARKQFQAIKQEALQWLAELKEQKKNQSTEKQNRVGPLLPQTPTMKRKLRKRKIPLVEDEEKENNAIIRTRRAASQIANAKFHQQLHMPLKMRRPSSPQTSLASSVAGQPHPKRVRVGKNLRVRMEDVSDSDDDMSISSKISLASVDSMASNVSEVAKKRGRRPKKAVVEPDDTITETEEPPVGVKKTRTRAQKKAAVEKIPQETSEEVDLTIADAIKTRHNRNKVQATIVEEPSTSNSMKSRCPHSNSEHGEKMKIEDMEITTHVEETDNRIIVNKLLQITLQRLPDNLSSTVNLTPCGTIINQAVPTHITTDFNKTTNKVEDMEITMAALKTKTPGTSKLVAQAPSNGFDLVALTPHLKGIVKERVNAVEKSLKKDDPAPKIPPGKKAAHKLTPDANISADLFESAESSPECDNSPSHFTLKSVATTRPSLRTSIKSRKLSKRSPSTPGHPFIVKLFDENTLRKRSRSFDQIASTSKTTTCTSGRMRVLTGMRTFAKPSARDVAQTALLEEEKKRKAEEIQRNKERAQDASKKKEEQLRLKREQKKRENEEKRTKAMLAQEARVREQEEAIRLEREREERKAALQRAREEKELQEKEHRKELRKQKMAEREQRLKEEEAARHAKAKEIALAAEEKHKEMKQREEERKVDKAPPGKVHVATKTATVHPLKQVATAVGGSKNTLNETFEVPQKAAEKKMHQKQQTVEVTSYVMTPSKDEVPRMLPKNPNDYGIDDVDEDDPSDDDEQPKKILPKWAQNLQNNMRLNCADYVSVGLRNRMFGTRVFKPSARELFGTNARPVHRRSSAIWNTPPNIHHQSLCASFISD